MRIDIALITFRDDEFEEVNRLFKTELHHIPGGRTYRLGIVEARDRRRYTIAIARSSEQGNDASHTLARDIIQDLSPRLILVVGIGGGMPSYEFTLGDVIISAHIYDLNRDALTSDGRTEYVSRDYWSLQRVVKFIDNILPEDLLDWSKGLARPELDIQQAKFTGGSDAWQKKIRDRLDYHFGNELRRSRFPLYKTGSIISSNHLVKNPLVMEDWSIRFRDALAIEMEAVGVFEAAQPNSDRNYAVPVLIIRGISDIPGLEREQQWTTYACQTAAAFAYAFIRMEPVHLLIEDTRQQRLEVPWLESLGRHIREWISYHFSRYYLDYQGFFEYRYQRLGTRKMTLGIYPSTLRAVFVEPQVEAVLVERASSNLLLPATDAVPDEQKTIWTFLLSRPLRKHNLVILGAPGRGKTTMLQHLGLSLFPEQRRSRKRSQRLSYRLPVLLFLPDHITAIEQQSQYLLADAVRAETYRWQQDKQRRAMPAGWIERYLQNGHCLVLLDGLDEVADAQVRQSLVKWIERQILAYHRNRFLVTSRPDGYRGNALENMIPLEVQPFTPAQIRQFLHAWYSEYWVKHGEKDTSVVHQKASRNAEELLNLLRQVPHLDALAVNPLLLTMIATMHCYHGRLPGTEIKLYQEICRVLLGKRLEMDTTLHKLQAERCLELLQLLAYGMMERGVREIGQADAQEIVREPLRLIDKELDPASFLRSIEGSSGLLSRRENGTYAFVHLTFQEYLAMEHIRSLHLEFSLITHMTKSWWRETILFYCAAHDASALIDACLEQASSSAYVLELAIDCNEAAREVQPSIEARLELLLREGAESRDPSQQHVVASALLARRARQMVYLKEEVYLDRSLITCAEYQPFLDEQSAQGLRFQPAHWASPHFSPGSGNDPLLGLDIQQAAEFARWRTFHARDGYLYRLPRADELENVNIMDELPEGTGCWLEGGGLVWTQYEAPKQAAADLTKIIEPMLSSTDIHLIDEYFRRAGGIIRDAARARARASETLYFPSSLASEDRANFLGRVEGRADEFLDEFKRALTLPLSRSFNGSQARAIALALALNFGHFSGSLDVRSRILSLIRPRILDFTYGRPFSFVLDCASDLKQALTDSQVRQKQQALVEKMLDIYRDLVLLEGRIQGHFPAREGILLVKEQKAKNHPLA